MEAPSNITLPTCTTFVYVAVKASLHAKATAVFGLNKQEEIALTKHFDNFSQEVINGVLLKGAPIQIVNALAELGYKVIGTTGESETVWTMQREV